MELEHYYVMPDLGAGERKTMGPSLSCLRLNRLCIYLGCGIYNLGAPPRALSMFITKSKQIIHTGAGICQGGKLSLASVTL